MQASTKVVRQCMMLKRPSWTQIPTETKMECKNERDVYFQVFKFSRFWIFGVFKFSSFQVFEFSSCEVFEFSICFEVFKFWRFRILKCCFRVFEFRVFQFSNLEFQIQSARPVVAAGVVDTPRHSLQRCRSKALLDVGIRKLSFVWNLLFKGS